MINSYDTADWTIERRATQEKRRECEREEGRLHMRERVPDPSPTGNRRERRAYRARSKR